jgi:hypothetical protein
MIDVLKEGHAQGIDIHGGILSIFPEQGIGSLALGLHRSSSCHIPVLRAI